MIRRLVLLGLAAPLATGPRAQPVVLADGRETGMSESIARWESHPAVREAMEAAGTYWRGRSDDYEEESQLMDAAEGAFVTAGAGEHAVLYLMSAWPRCCPKMGVAFIEEDRLVLNLAFEATAQTIDTAPDLNGDGRNEIVFTGEFGMGGQVSRSMTLASFGPSGLEDVGTASIFDSSCGAGDGSGVSSASRVTAETGGTISLTVEQYTQPCAGGAWRGDGSAETLVLDPVADLRYVEIPITGSAPAPLGARSLTGRLESGDQTLTSGEYVDRYDIQCRRGQLLVLDLRATEFDPYLIFRPPVGDQLDNDDHEGDRTHSRIEVAPAQEGGCEVIVTSYQPGEVGAYELTIGGE